MSTITGPTAIETDVPLELLHLELVSRLAEKRGHEREKGLADLELLGYNAGYRIIERLTREHPKFKDELDLMKFICKDFWTSVFKKQIDNLRTNHQGVYVLQDKNFKFLSKVSAGRQYFGIAPGLAFIIRESVIGMPPGVATADAPDIGHHQLAVLAAQETGHSYRFADGR